MRLLVDDLKELHHMISVHRLPLLLFFILYMYSRNAAAMQQQNKTVGGDHQTARAELVFVLHFAACEFNSTGKVWNSEGNCCEEQRRDGRF